MNLIFAFCLYLAGSTFAALDIPPHLEAPMRILHQACQKETNVAEEYISATREGYVPDVEELKCYIHCLFDHAGMIGPDGRIIHGTIRHLLSPSVLESFDHVTEICETLHATGRCEAAYLTLKCFFETLPKGSLLP